MLSFAARATQLMLLFLHLLLLIARPTAGFSKVNVPERIVAGQEVRVTLVADYNGDSNRKGSVDARFTHYEMFLSGVLPIDPEKDRRENAGEEIPLCMLLNRTEVHGGTSEVSLQIPISAVPAPGRYALAIQQYNVRDEDNVMPDFSTSPSPSFKLIMPSDSNDGHGTRGGQWAEFESDPRLPFGIGDPFNVPCHAFDCVRHCFQKHYPKFVEHLDDLDAMRPMMKCKAECPGVHTPDEMRGIFDGQAVDVDTNDNSDAAAQEL